MRTVFKSFVRDQRGATMPEYALLLFAVLISAAAAAKRIGPRAYIAGNVTTRLLAGEDVTVEGASGNAIGGLTMPDPGSAANSAAGESSGSTGSSAGGGGSSGASSSGGGESSVSAAGDSIGGSSAVGGGGGGASVGSSGSSIGGGGGGGGILNGGGVVLGATGSQPAGSGEGAAETADESIASNQSGVTGAGESTDGIFGGGASSPASASSPSSAPASAGGGGSSSAASHAFPGGFIGGTGSQEIARASTSAGASQNTVNPPPPSDSSTGATQGDGYTISAQGEKEMQALLAQAKKNADGKRPLGKCYHVVKTDIDEVGYGDLAKLGNTAFPKQIPGSDQEYAHQFADYMNAKGANGQTNASNLGLQKLPITNPYDAPPGSIIVVRAGTPGTRNPVAGDIVVAGGNGKFYNDGNMGYGGSKNFPKGNSYVLGIYAPK